MWIVPICIVFSFATSIVTTKILAEHHFKMIDKYVDDVCEETKRFTKEIKEVIKSWR